jgi:lysozyme family protein
VHFGDCIDFTLRPENDGQPYHVTVGDSGGATAWGITLRALSDHLGRTAKAEELQQLTRDVANAIYQRNYWNTVNGDKLPIGIDLLVFDHGVMSGPARSVKLMQHLIGAREDGIAGPLTLAALEKHDTEAMIDAIERAQIAYYRSATTFDRFGNGWLARAARRANTARAWLRIA